jgi:hypothetical protein
MYREQMMMTRMAGAKNLYFDRKPYSMLVSRFDYCWYTMPITNDPNRVKMSNSIGTYPEYSANPLSDKNFGVHSS